MPRKYSMERRSGAVDQTRDRIVEATVALHGEKGILATSMQDIAARAGVSLGTVYRHFPTVDDLIPACGGRIMETHPPPTTDVFAHLAGEERIGAFMRVLYAHYAATERTYFVGFAEAPALPVLESFMTEAQDAFRALIAELLAPFDASTDLTNLAMAMADFFAWYAFHRAGFDADAAAQAATEVVMAQLRRQAAV